MKNLMEYCNKKYNKTLIADKDHKQSYEKMKECLEANDIPAIREDDAFYFWMEIVYNSIQIKQHFEDVFFDTYVKMFDYWYDLTYLERKKQMNTDIERFKKDLSFFREGNQEIYMPCFNQRFNHLYAQEIVLLDLKQYHTFIRSYAKEVKEHLYGVKPYLCGFSSAQVIAQAEDCYVLYHAVVNRFYVYRKDQIVSTLSLDPKQISEDTELLKRIGDLLLLEREDDIISLLLDSDLIHTKVKHKLKNYLQKKQKQKIKLSLKEEKQKKN